MLARRRIAFVFALAFMPIALAASAEDVQPDQTIAVLLTTAPGAPTADDFVAYYEGQQFGPPPLQGLTVGNPQKIVYLMPMVILQRRQRERRARGARQLRRRVRASLDARLRGRQRAAVSGCRQLIV